jgi:hypothetical protein
MELLTLEPTFKIDFGLQHSTAHLKKWLQRRYHVSKWNSHRILAALSAQGPLFIGWASEWASRKICLGAVRTDNCATGFFEIFAEKSFLY